MFKNNMRDKYGWIKAEHVMGSNLSLIFYGIGQNHAIADAWPNGDPEIF